MVCMPQFGGFKSTYCTTSYWLASPPAGSATIFHGRAVLAGCECREETWKHNEKRIYRFVEKLGILQNPGLNDCFLGKLLRGVPQFRRTQILDDSDVFGFQVLQTLYFQDLQDCFALCCQPLLREEELRVWGEAFCWVLPSSPEIPDWFPQWSK